jgi:hypothetical protein
MSLSSDGAVMTMPVTPAYQGGNGGFGGWGGDWASWILLFVIFGLFGGGWGNGFGGGFGGANGPGFQGYATRSDINEGFALNNLQSGINSIQNGICDTTYSLTNAINNGFHGVDTAVCNLGYQLQDCCCQTQRAVDGVNYNLATQGAAIQNAIQGVRYDMATQACDTRNTIQSSTRDIIDNANANSRAILDFLTQDKIASLTAENQSLKFQASQAAQNAFITANQEAQTAELIRRINPMPVPAYQVPNPYAGCGCYNSCGC